jgi:hypothetical protein
VHFDRLRVVSALPLDGGWRADLAIDRSTTPPRAVLVARVPPSVSGDALALSVLARGLDLAARVQHPGLRRLLGTGEVDGDLVLVEAWREGESLRGLIEAGGSLPPALAARVGVEVAGALHACHTLPAALGRPLCHGAVRTERILLTEAGEVLLCGVGRPFSEDATPADDLRALARVLLECLPPAGANGPGPLAAVLDRVLDGEGYPSAADFALALAAAVTPGDPAALAARVEGSQPEGTPRWLSHRRALAQALRGEDGASADEVGSTSAQAEAARTLLLIPPPPAPALPAPGAPSQVSPPTARPALTPPPLPVTPSTAPTSPAMERATLESPAVAPAAEAPPAPGPALVAAPVTPPVEPAAAPAAPGAAPAAPAIDQYIEVGGAQPAAPRPGPATPAAPSLAAWLDHPRAPAVVVAGCGLLGLLLGLALGGRS